jgi:predicted ArsR family transcriptional regulator
MSTTRDLILRTILSRQRCSVIELAEAVGINPVSVRHHIGKLESDGMLDSEDERQGVGRPRRVYFLTQAALEKFPTRYLQLTKRLLDQVKDTLPPAILEGLFTQMGASLAEDIHADHELSDLSMEERLDLLQHLLEKEGFNVEWSRSETNYTIKELNCPYYHVGQDHPEVCAIDQTVISSVLSVPATKINCILDGDSFCTYEVPLIQPGDIQVQNTH